MTATASLVDIPLAKLEENPNNPRRMFEKVTLAELAASIVANGIYVPLLVRETKTPGCYQIVAGARRFRAAKMAKLDAVPCLVREFTDRGAMEAGCVENMQREDLHPIDEGLSLARMHDELKYTLEQLAEKIGRSVSFVSTRIQLAKLPPTVQTLLLEEKIILSHALLVARIPSAKLQDKAAQAIARGVPSTGEKPMPYRAAIEYVRRNFQCDLREAPFPTADKKLLPDVGACGPCQFNSTNQRNLFDDVDGGGKQAAHCTNPDCFSRKTAANWQRERAKVVEKGGEVLQGKVADTALGSSAMVQNLKESPNEDYTRRRNWESLTKGQELKPVLVQGRNGEAITCYRRADLVKAAKANKIRCFDKPKATKSHSGVVPGDWQKRREEQERVQGLVNARLLPAIAAKAEALAPAAAWRVIIADYVSAFVVDDVGKRRGLNLKTNGAPGRWSRETQAALEAMPVAELQGLAIEILACELPERVCEELGVDAKKVEQGVRAEEKATAKAAAAAAKLAAREEAKAAKIAAKTAGKSQPKQSPGLAFVISQLRVDPKFSFADLQKNAKRAGIMVYPIEFGRAQAVLGLKKQPSPPLSGLLQATGELTGFGFAKQQLAENLEATFEQIKKAGKAAGVKVTAKDVGQARAEVFDVPAKGKKAKVSKGPSADQVYPPGTVHTGD